MKQEKATNQRQDVYFSNTLCLRSCLELYSEDVEEFRAEITELLRWLCCSVMSLEKETLADVLFMSYRTLSYRIKNVLVQLFRMKVTNHRCNSEQFTVDSADSPDIAAIHQLYG